MSTDQDEPSIDDLEDERDVAEAAAAREEDEWVLHRDLMAELGLGPHEEHDSAEAAWDLIDIIGPTLVAALAGTSDRTTPEAWARRAGPGPSAKERRRLQVAHLAVTAISDVVSEELARDWITAGDDQLGSTPVRAIREDRHEEIAVAVDRVLS